MLALAAPRPLLGLLGMESPGDPACTGRLPVAVGQWFAEDWLGSRTHSMQDRNRLTCFHELWDRRIWRFRCLVHDSEIFSLIWGELGVCGLGKVAPSL